MTDTSTEAPRAPVYVIKKHHMRWAIAGFAILVLAIIVGVFYAAGGNVGSDKSGGINLTKPSLETLQKRIRVTVKEQEQGQPQPETAAIEPAPAYGDYKSDFVGRDGQIGHDEGTRFAIYDKLSGDIAKTNESIAKLASAVQGVDDHVSQLGDKVEKIDTRVTALENKDVKAAPSSPAPQPQGYVPPFGPLGPQSNVVRQQPAQVAQNDEPPVGQQPIQEAGPRVVADVRNLPPNWSITSIDKGNSEQTCNRAEGKKLVLSAHWVWKNHRHFFPFNCVPLDDPRPEAR